MSRSHTNSCFPSQQGRRRDGRVAEGARLESVFTRKGNVGSNPTLSAMHFSRVNTGFNGGKFDACANSVLASLAWGSEAWGSEAWGSEAWGSERMRHATTGPAV